MPALGEMADICRRLADRLQRGPLDQHRLREQETIIRLLAPHLSRLVADGVQSHGRRPELRDAGRAFMEMEECLTWLQLHRDSASDGDMQQHLTLAVDYALRLLAAAARM